MKGWQKLGLGLTLVCAMVAGAWWTLAGKREEAFAPEAIVKLERGDLSLKVSDTGRVQPLAKVDLKSRVSGQVLVVHVREGERVRQGEVLLELDPRDFKRRVTEAEADLGQARADYLNLRAGPRPAEHLDAQAGLAAAGARLARARQEQERARQAEREGAITPRERLEAETSFAEAEAAWRQLQARRDLLAQGPRVGELQAAHARVRRAEVALTAARDALADTVLRAPMDGTVIFRGIEPGEMVQAGQAETSARGPLLTVADLNRLIVEAKINQIDVARLKQGQKVELRVDTMPDERFDGVVRTVAPAAEAGTEKDVLVFPVELLLTSANATKLRPGMGADFDVFIESKPEVLWLPVEAVRPERAGKAKVTRLVGPKGQRKKEVVDIKVGLHNDHQFEVLEGLKPGDEVLIEPAEPKGNVNRF